MALKRIKEHMIDKDFTDKVDNLSKAPNEFEWTATEGQLTYVLPASASYDPNSKWLEVSLGGAPVAPSLIEKTDSTKFKLLVDASVVKSGMKVVARWVEPFIPATAGHGNKHELGGQDEIDLTNMKGYDVVEGIQSQLANTPKQPLRYTGIGTGQEILISEAFPSVTLADVQLLNPTATLSDTADWYVLQKLVNDGDMNGYKRLNFPVGNFILSKPLDFTEKLSNCVIESTGCILKPSAGYFGELVKLSRGDNHGKSRNLRIVGLLVNGLFRSSVGILVDDAQEWFLDNVKIHNCFVGIELIDTWYGEFTGESIVQNCLTGVKTTVGGSNEINTIDFNNLKVNFGYDKKLSFIPKNTGESDTDYNNRVLAIGFEFNTMVNTCKFYGLVVEGMDYAFYTSKYSSVGSSVFSIENCYIEAIKKELFRFVSEVGTPIMYYYISVKNCRWASVPKATIGQGRFEIKKNEDFLLNIQSNISYRTYLETDLPNEYITSSRNNDYIFIKNNYIPFNANALKYNNFNDNNNSPSQVNMLPTIQDSLTLEHKPRIRSTGARTKNSQVFSVHTKPLTFVGKGSAPVIQGANGKYYMLSTVDGSALTLKEVKNLYRLDVPVDGMTSKELYRRTSAAGEEFFNVDIQQKVVFKDGKWKQKAETSNEMIALGTTSDFISIKPPNTSSWYSPEVWNVQIDAGYTWQGAYWGFMDWYGNESADRAIGTISQRPTSPVIDGHIYYATDESKYYIWNSSTNSYSEFTPLF